MVTAEQGCVPGGLQASLEAGLASSPSPGGWGGAVILIAVSWLCPGRLDSLLDAGTNLSLAWVSWCPPPQAPAPPYQSNTSPTAPACEAPLPPAVPLNPELSDTQATKAPDTRELEGAPGIIQPSPSTCPAKNWPRLCCCSPPRQRAHYLSGVVPVVPWGCCLGWRRAVLVGSVDGWRLSCKRCGLSFPVSRGGLSAPWG